MQKLDVCRRQLHLFHSGQVVLRENTESGRKDTQFLKKVVYIA